MAITPTSHEASGSLDFHPDRVSAARTPQSTFGRRVRARAVIAPAGVVFDVAAQIAAWRRGGCSRGRVWARRVPVGRNLRRTRHGRAWGLRMDERGMRHCDAAHQRSRCANRCLHSGLSGAKGPAAYRHVDTIGVPAKGRCKY